MDLKLIDGVPHWSARGADTFTPFSSIIYVGTTNGTTITVPEGLVPDDAVASDFFVVSSSGASGWTGGQYTNQRPSPGGETYQGQIYGSANLSVTSYANRVLTIKNSFTATCPMTVYNYTTNATFQNVCAYYIKGGLPTSY